MKSEEEMDKIIDELKSQLTFSVDKIHYGKETTYNLYIKHSNSGFINGWMLRRIRDAGFKIANLTNTPSINEIAIHIDEIEGEMK